MKTASLIDQELERLAQDIGEIEKALSRKPVDAVDDWSDTDGDQALDLSDDNDEPDDDPDDEDIEKAIPGSRHKFEALTDFVADRDGVSKDTAMATARREFPEVYASYQGSGLAKNNNYRALVEAEIAKGCSVDVAVQRVAYAYPELARQTIAKAQNSPAEFMAKVDLEIQRTGCSRLEGMSRVRKSNPATSASTSSGWLGR